MITHLTVSKYRLDGIKPEPFYCSTCGEISTHMRSEGIGPFKSDTGYNFEYCWKCHGREIYQTKREYLYIMRKIKLERLCKL